MRGPVDAYFTERTANAKQRLLAAIESPTCAVPGCRRPATDCQVHHIQAYSQGGPTNQAKLTMLCRYHNGTNDDDPEHTSRYGRIVRRNGTLMWLSPKGRLHPVEATPLEEIPPDLLPTKPRQQTNPQPDAVHHCASVACPEPAPDNRDLSQ